MMGPNRKLLVGTIALVLIIGLFVGTGVIMAQGENEPSNGEESDEDEEPWYCHDQEEHEDHYEGHHEDDDHHHGGRHHHEDGSFGGNFVSTMRRFFGY